MTNEDTKSQDLAEIILSKPAELGRALFQCNGGRRLILQILRAKNKVKREGLYENDDSKKRRTSTDNS